MASTTGQSIELKQQVRQRSLKEQAAQDGKRRSLIGTEDVSPGQERGPNCSTGTLASPAESESRVPETARRNVMVRSSSKHSDEEIIELRDSMKFMFQSPCEQFAKKRKVNCKPVLQVGQVIFITVLMFMFHSERVNFEKFLQTNRIAFRHIFLKDWNPDLEVLPYPPASGDYAMYTQEELYDHMNFVLYRYYKFDELALTSMRPQHEDSVTLDINFLTKSNFNHLDHTYDVDSHKLNTSIELPRNMKDTKCRDTASPEKCYQIQDYLGKNNHSIDLHKIIDMTMDLSLHGVNVQVFDKSTFIPIEVKCVTFRVKIKYDNSRGSGQFLVKLTADLDMRYCDNKEKSSQNTSIEKKNSELKIWLVVYDVFVLVLCSITMGIGIRSFLHRKHLLKKTKELFWDRYRIKMTVPEKSEFLTMWIFQHMFTDILIIIGTAFKIYLKFGHVIYDESFANQRYYNAAAIFLGFGNLSQWFGLIRYIAYFDHFYILVLTISKAIPAVIRFMICGTVMFVGYLFAGWIILGPYNEKFETLSSASLSLFSLVNGDEIYSTMSIINRQDHPVEIWLFSWVYLYSYIPLFIFVVANLFIAVIMESYEALKRDTGYKKSFLKHFYEDTVNEIGTAEFEEAQDVYDETDGNVLERRFGILAPLICCGNKCAKQQDAIKTTSFKSAREDSEETRSNKNENTSV